jgi:putative transposase
MVAVPWVLTLPFGAVIVINMPRTARIVLDGVPHHVTQRGNNRENVFFSAQDRDLYLSLLTTQCRQHDVAIDGYCLMTNHVHLILCPERAEGLALAVGRTHFEYANCVNLARTRSGHLWQGRFHSCPLDESHFVSALRYVERNPVRAGLVRLPWEYPWSSAAWHVSKMERDFFFLDPTNWTDLVGDMDWTSYICQNETEEDLAAIRNRTTSDIPWAEMDFIRKMEALTGRRLRPGMRGRPQT